MGIVICESHGQSGLDLVSPSLRSASMEQRRVPRDQVVVVRYTLLDDYPPSMAFLDSVTAKRHDITADRVLTLDDLDLIDVELEPVCSNCFGEWLQLNGVDASLSPKEARFMRLARRLQGLTQGVLQPAFDQIAEDVHRAFHPRFIQCVGSIGFGSAKSMPFSASCGFILSGNLQDERDLTVSATCWDRGTLLECECRIRFARSPARVLDGPRAEVSLEPPDYEQFDSDRVSTWAKNAERFVTEHRKAIVDALLSV